MKFMRVISKPVFGFGRKYKKAKDGVAAIEFALIAPVMLIMYLGMAEVTMLISADRVVSHTASVVGDLVTQEESINATQMEDIFNAAIAVMGQDSVATSRISMDVTSLEVDTSGNVQTVGYAKLGNGFSAPFTYGNSNSTLLNQTSGLVITRIKFEYISPSGMFVKSPELTETFMLKPRKSQAIPFSGGGNSTNITCTAGGSGTNPNTSC